MKKVKIITDSCSDLDSELLKEYDIDYAKMSTMASGAESPALLSWSPNEVREFYNSMRNGKRITTAQVSIEEFMRIFKKYLDEGFDIVYIGCSLKQSGSVNTASVVAKNLEEDYPDSKIICIDSQNASIGEGMLAIEAAKMATCSYDAEYIANRIVQIRKTVNEFATVHSLDNLKKAGRVSASSAFLGNLMNIKPILVSDAVGAQAALKKVNGRKNSLKEIVRLLKDNIIDAENQTVYVAHSDCPQNEVDELCRIVKEEINCRNVRVGYIGPIIGASVGPDAIGVWAFGNTVTFCAS